MESAVKKYQQRFRKVEDEIDRWEELHTRLLSQFANASSIIQRLQVIQGSKNYGALKCIQGIEDAVLAKQLNSLQTILLSMNKTLEGFHSIVLSFEKIVRDSRQQLKGGSAQPTVKQLQQRIGIKPSLADCLDGLTILSEMHQSEYRLKLSLVSATSTLALKPSVTDDLSVLQQLLVDQPNIPKEEVQFIFDIIFAEDIC
ncbi:uncharacterized protein At5g43822-like [Ipomoea triloba]|uniref:uncharacterized protein At5g43822-like n=1 Tax=Ipomoea triloba TaxID=35885 RepID=UPI00125CDC8A|nr:uncharacterized protein At5g43822-like [Ipomoea triloba]XP_031117391.1 uncharacterized protein At5g43822-like [Ipomoea triloba]XP_031117392.1 uncharacterized protein At5g43822-like [Ipomoea triloba]